MPNETSNDAFVEVPGSTPESVLLVPPTLSDGTYYVTIYGSTSPGAAFTSGNPVITDVPFTSTTVNLDAARVGWQLYRVLDVASQLGALGWELSLSNQPPGTEIALRRNAVPGRWNFRNNGSAGTAGAVDASTTAGILQRPNHQADIWYVGVYHPTIPTGNFTLRLRGISPLAPDLELGGSVTVSGQRPDLFAYRRIDVPPGVLGWDLRLIDVTSGDPRLVLRRDRLPDSLQSHDAAGAGWGPAGGAGWPSGNQWAPAEDWSGYPRSATGAVINGQLFAAGLNNPVQPGTYYVGILGAPGSSNLAYTIRNRFIGTEDGIPVGTLPFQGGIVGNPALPWREADYFRLTIPSNTPSWRLRLTPTNGEALLLVARGVIPSIEAGTLSPSTPNAGRKLQKAGPEHFVLLPASTETSVPAGDYYVAVVSEGRFPSAAQGRYGTNTVGYTLESLGPVVAADLGSVSAVDLVHNDALAAGEMKAYRFDVPPGVLGLEVRLEDATGAPRGSLRAGTALPAAPSHYGNNGGQTAGAQDGSLMSVFNPAPGPFTLVVQATDLAATNGATFTLRLHTLGAVPLPFDGSPIRVTDQPVDTWRYFRVTVPSGPLGWDIRLSGITNGDPQVVVRRSLAPDSLSSHELSGGSWGPTTGTNWPAGAQWAAGSDWTDYTFGPGGVSELGRRLVMGMGNPLEPGDYIIGVCARTTTGLPLAYTLSNAGIGPGFSQPVAELAFDGGTASIASLAPRDAAFYRVNVPAGTPAWQFRLATVIGESMVVLQKDFLPNVGCSSQANPVAAQGGRRISKAGAEFFALLPALNQVVIPAGTYYLAVISEGRNPAGSTIGSNTVAATLASAGVLPVADLGTLAPASDLVRTGALPGSEFQVFRFTVPPGTLSLSLRLDDRVGEPWMTLRTGTGIPQPHQAYGYSGGQAASWSHGSLINLPNPVPGDYTLTVRAASPATAFPDASFTLRIQAAGTTPVDFGAASLAVSNQSPGSWRYFAVTVPSNTAGWDLRLTQVTSGDPRLVVRRDRLPDGLSTHDPAGASWVPHVATNWPSGAQWAAGTDWTEAPQAANGTNETGHTLAAGLGNPLTPGDYTIGVTSGNGPGAGNALAYTLVSRGIGTAFPIPVIDLPATGGSHTHPGLPPREAAYYRVEIPANTPQWRIELNNLAGEGLLLVNHRSLPGIGGDASSPLSLAGGRRLRRAGSESYVLLPEPGRTQVTPGVYYVAVVSQGENPTSSRTGTNVFRYTLTTPGPLPTDALGSPGDADLLVPVTLRGGALRSVGFTLAPGAATLELSLENVTGSPRMALRRGSALASPAEGYGHDGGETATWEGADWITITSPAATNYTLVLHAAGLGSGYPDAAATLRIRRTLTRDLNFSAADNPSGGSNRISGVLADRQRAFHRVVVPDRTAEGPVLGWHLALQATTGAPVLRARRDLLPVDNDSGQLAFTAGPAMIVPPFLTPGTWYVEVKAVGACVYTLTSQPVLLQRPAWQLPADGQPVTTHGVTAPEFGDTGTAPDGSPLPGDRGTDLEQGGLHFHAVVVPPGNGGLYRVNLEAISGNPDLYLREGALPTLTHDAAGRAGELQDRSLTGAGSEYANWVAVENRYQHGLPPGVHYLAVRAAGNANARYRLRLSTGRIEDIALHGTDLTALTVPARDFRHFRVTVPDNAPAAWRITFQQIIGDVVLHVRDTTPPGQAGSPTEIIDWADDAKNHGPYPAFDLPGTYTLAAPQLRPGHTYYLGFRGVTDATFTLATSTNAANLDFLQFLNFRNGLATNVLPAAGVARYRINIPATARRWRHATAGGSQVRYHLELGSAPTVTAIDHWSGAGNATHNAALHGANPWPWVPGQSAFLVITNTATVPLPFSFAMNGRECDNDDEDADGLPDCWELANFGSTSPTAAQDPDNDGNSNLVEFRDTTDPRNPTSLLARLTVQTNGPGAVVIEPGTGPYPYGTPVSLTAVPPPGHRFTGWSGSGATGSNSSIVLLMTTNRTVTAGFTRDYGPHGETRADYRFEGNLLSSVGQAPPLALVQAGAAFADMPVDGRARIVLRFPTGTGLGLQPALTVIPGNTYTLVMLCRLDTVTGYRRLLTLRNPAGDEGLYVRDGRLTFSPLPGQSAVCVTNHAWHQIVLTRTAAGALAVYCDGQLRLSVADPSGNAVLNPGTNTITLFKDNGVEETGGWIARFRNFATALSDGEVAVLNRLPTVDIPLVLADLTVLPDGQTAVTVTGPPAPGCRVEESFDLVQWNTVTQPTPFPGTLRVVLPARGQPARFLRAVLVP